MDERIIITLIVAVAVLLGLLVMAFRYKHRGKVELSILDWLKLSLTGENPPEESEQSETVRRDQITETGVRLEQGAQLHDSEIVGRDKITTNVYPPSPTSPAPPQLPELALKIFPMDRVQAPADEIILKRPQPVAKSTWTQEFGLALENMASTATAKGIGIRVEFWWGGGDHLRVSPLFDIPPAAEAEGWQIQYRDLIDERPAVLTFSGPHSISFPRQPKNWGGFRLTLGPGWHGWLSVKYTISSAEPIATKEGRLRITVISSP